MAKLKSKSKKRVNKTAVRSSREDAVRSNPFEIRVNRKKHNILGRKTERNERGLPGVSRSRAIEKRKKTLLKEYKNRHKTKNLLDRRFGEKDETLTQEEKNIQRQIKLAESTHRKKNIYNLEEEDLTHYGQSIGDIEDFDDLQLSSDEDNEVDDTETHFGGFLKKKSQLLSDNVEETNSAPKKTRKQAIEELVVKSKQHKFERQKEKEKVEELLEAIDNQWSNVHSLILRNRRDTKENKGSTKLDDFDKIVKELESEPRAALSSDRTKTPEEKDRLEKERLKALEEERNRRMANNMGGEDSVISGDQDINNRKKTDNRVLVEYVDGISTTSLKRTDTANEECIGEDGESTSEDEDDGDSDNMEDQDEDQDYDEDDGSVMEDSDSEDMSVHEVPDDGQEVDCEEEDECQTIRIPDVDVSVLLSECSPSQCEKTVNDTIAKFSSNNTKEIESLFSSTLKYCLTMAESLDTVGMETIHSLAKPLFRMCQASSTHCINCIQSHLKQSFKRYQKSFKKDSVQFPINKDVILFKIIEILFPMSDFRHPVTTPTIQLMTLGINKKESVTTLDVVIRKSFVCQILIKCLSLSKRYIPELLNYLKEFINLYSSTNDEGMPCTGSLSSSNHEFSQSLNEHHKPLSLLQLFSESSQSDSVSMLSLFYVSVKQVHQLSSLWDSVPLYDVIFNPILMILKNIEIHQRNSEIHDSLTATIASIEHNGCTRSLPILQLLRQKPKSIRFFEPSVDMDYQPGRKKYSHKSTGEKLKLKYKHKREMKGAIREIRKDSKFLAKERIKEQAEKDAIRRKKVKQIDGWLQQERGEARVERFGTRRRRNDKKK